MKAHELRVGNLVNYNGKVVKVEQITKRKIGYHTKPNETRMNYARLCEVEPIPITDELLLKNGFELTDKPIVKTDLRLQPHFVYRKSIEDTNIDIDPVQLFIFQRGIGNMVNICDVRHLHQLQNAYYLAANKELEIEL